MKHETLGSRLLFFCLFVINLSFFISANSQPIKWQQSEMTVESFYWSANLYGKACNTLHSDLRFEDFEKILSIQKSSALYRARPLSYLLELLSSKVFIWTQQISFRKYSLIILHVLNALLLYRVLRQLLSVKIYSAGCAMLFLNSGVALSTLFFPFRNARMLCLFFFLLSWLTLLKKDTKFSELSRLRIHLFCLSSICCFFSDEFSFVLYPFLALFLLMREGRSLWKNSHTNLTIIVTAVIYLLLSFGLYQTARIIDPSKSTVEYASFFHYFSIDRFFDGAFYQDVFESYFLYFLRFVLGYWDHTLPGILALLAMLLGIVLFLAGPKEKRELHIAFLCFLWIFLIAVFVPHYCGLHREIMPPHAGFPSLLYFGYYYTYIPLFFFVLGFAFLLKKPVGKKKWILPLFLCGVTIINYSNVRHLSRGIESAKIFHDNEFELYHAIENVLDFNTKKERFLDGAVYLSFPSGSKQRFSPRAKSLVSLDHYAAVTPLLKSFLSYNFLVPFQFLVSIENGDVIISLDNIETVKRGETSDELVQARYFYDLEQRKGIDLFSVRKNQGISQFYPEKIESGEYEKNFYVTAKDEAKELIFFVKGGSYLSVCVNGQEKRFVQNYGQSYQLFSVPVKSVEGGLDIDLKIHQMIKEHAVYLVGPFLLP